MSIKYSRVTNRVGKAGKAGKAGNGCFEKLAEKAGKYISLQDVKIGKAEKLVDVQEYIHRVTFI